ncbi:hypothetical protein Back11_42880 [Paenibacillus baekrokdamisoli]|uniref:Uncharacterized protein n=1 Tax=Paenibacillus baekrokdamisoli TaxID=1712516 RepID=A0A3G9JD94_9BACL|nr:DUF1761 domain-containing protein [Paenibacillus baekrokdamisoli]MBB3068009.1 hypothetical protein [Paenibacillus baekrokdamisoli]BBH22943.1 hypothetical protein Back11_42880 [Paenibacillus baekrokdamisoli]
MEINITELNYFAVLVGGLVYMAFGAAYYSPVLFGRTWMQLNKANLDKRKSKLPMYVASPIVAFLSSFLMAVIVQAASVDDIGSGILLGLIVGLLLAVAYLKNAAFGLMSRKEYAIAIGDHGIALHS